MLSFFRIVSFIEGISYLLILCVTLGFIDRALVTSIGMGHGVLFMVYFVCLSLVSHRQAWSVYVWLLMFFAALIPFAFIPVEIFLKKESIKE